MSGREGRLSVRQVKSGIGFDRSQVAFMGYWRRGVAMRS